MAKKLPELAEFTEEALDLGFGCFTDGDPWPFILLVFKTGKRDLVELRSADETISEMLLNNGREIIQGFDDGLYYALVWDGYLTRSGKRQEAVFAEIGSSDGQAFVLAQRYKRPTSADPAKVGKPLQVSEAGNLWSDNGDSTE